LDESCEVDPVQVGGGFNVGEAPRKPLIRPTRLARTGTSSAGADPRLENNSGSTALRPRPVSGGEAIAVGLRKAVDKYLSDIANLRR